MPAGLHAGERVLAWPRVAALGWLAVVAGGFGLLWQYASARGEESSAPREWPRESALPRTAGAPALLVFVHPHCSCSHATLVELGRILRRVPGRVDPLVVFVRPTGVPAGWEQTELRELAERLPAVRVVDDPGGTEARRFGARTSGASLLFDVEGRLSFAGGITSVRGHEGNSFGQERIVALLRAHPADRHDSPVFGCPLDEPSAAEEHTR